MADDDTSSSPGTQSWKPDFSDSDEDTGTQSWVPDFSDSDGDDDEPATAAKDEPAAPAPAAGEQDAGAESALTRCNRSPFPGATST